MVRLLRLIAVAAVVAPSAAAVVLSAAAVADETIGGMPKADAERLIQNYLGIWSNDAGVNRGSVARFYAPRVIYYGKAFSRSAVLDDKLDYIRQWPEREYREVPGSLTGTCNGAQTLCRVTFEMTWRRVSRTHEMSTGRARVWLDFVPVEGRRKITRERAQLL